MDSIVLRPFAPSDTDWLVARHGEIYTREEGFDATFAPLVASILAAFNADHDDRFERGWIAEEAGQRLGSIFCVRAGEHTAKLRLFLLVPAARGRGLGRRMLDTCMEFARSAGYSDMTLWTHESHLAACALYQRAGWSLVSSKPVHSFGRPLVEQEWRIAL